MHTDDPLSCREQIALKPPRQVPTVLDCPAPFVVEVLGHTVGPDQQLEMIGAGGAECLLSELAA
jgi:hypothetical protein